MNGSLSAPALLSLLQLSDSAFPTGLYAHSHGLEGMVNRGLVKTAGDLEAFLRTQLTSTVLPADGVALLQAHRLPAEAIDIDRHLFAMKLPAELRTASCQTGRRLLSEVAASFLPDGGRGGPESFATLVRYSNAVTRREAPGNAAVALALVARALEIPAQAALLASCHTLLISSLGAAMRLLPMTHTDTQQILRRLHAVIIRELPRVLATRWMDMTAFAPQFDLVAVAHESDDVRMFAS